MTEIEKKGRTRTARPIMPWGDLPRASAPAESGLLLIDKDQGVTSHDVVGAVRRLAGTRKVGHGGTLDPMACGLLTVGIGRATKLLTYLSACEKKYSAEICLGAATNTEDADGEVIFPVAQQMQRLKELSIAEIDVQIAALNGEILQVPSGFSALKINGKRAYDLARAGIEVNLAPRPVVIHSFRRITQVVKNFDLFTFPVITFQVEVECSAGTYIRALARDLGLALGVGAHLRMLRRTKVRNWDVSQAETTAEYGKLIRAGKSLPVISISNLCAQLFPIVKVSDAEATLLAGGQFIPYRQVSANNAPVSFECALEENDSALSRNGFMPSATVASVSENQGVFEKSSKLAAFTGDGKAVALISRRGKYYKPDLQLKL